MNQNLTKILCFSLLALVNGVIGGILFCNYHHKEQPSVVYDLEYIADSINRANAIIDTNIAKQETKIIYEKQKLKEIFINIDSLSYDSAYRYWAAESFRYKPILD